MALMLPMPVQGGRGRPVGGLGGLISFFLGCIEPALFGFEQEQKHEICHTVGIGTSPLWSKLVVNGVFTGTEATKLLREITKDKDAVLHADRMHFWPYGLNYDKEVKSEDDLINHCKMVEAICKDLKAAE